MIKSFSKKKPCPVIFTFLVLVLATACCFSGCSMKKSTSSANSGKVETLDGNLYHATASNGYFISLSFKNGQFKFSDNLSSFQAPDSKGVYGEYSIDGNIVNLPCKESDNKFTLTLSGDKLYLDKEKSSSLNVIESGMDFEELFKNEDVCFTLIEHLDEK